MMRTLSCLPEVARKLRLTPRHTSSHLMQLQIQIENSHKTNSLAHNHREHELNGTPNYYIRIHIHF
jgi:hypothetical protein